MDGLYSRITRKSSKAAYDIPLISTITFLSLLSAALIISVIYLMGCNRRFIAFVSDLSGSTFYAYRHESLIAKADGNFYKVSGKNIYGIYSYIALSKSGRESRKIPEGEPVVLDYGDGSILQLWDLPDNQEENRHILFIRYTDPKGKSFSYINYKMTLENILIRYLVYSNNEVLE